MKPAVADTPAAPLSTLTPAAVRKSSRRPFHICRSLREPLQEIKAAGNGGTRAYVGELDRPHIPASRTLDLTSDRTTDRFIKAVIRRRGELAEHDRYLRRLGKPGLFGPLPKLAGGAGRTQAAAGTASRQGVAATPSTMAAETIPFDQASKRGIEPGPSFTFKPGAGTVNLGVSPLPAQGFLRQVEIDILTTAKGKKGAAEEQSADYPWDMIETARFQDTNGNQLDDIPGFVLWLDNVFGGYAGAPDPRIDPNFSKAGEATSWQSMLVRELAPNGFGAIANLSASQAYKLTLKMAPESQIWKKSPEENPTFTVSIWMHFWQLPEPVSLDGRAQIQTPPFHGTTQYRWWAPANTVTQNVNLKIEQVGNEIRNIICIGREKNGVRSNAVFPEPFQLRWDTEFLLLAGLRQLRKIARELINDLGGIEGESASAGGYPIGVVILPFNFGEGRLVGGSGVNSWLPTVTGTRLQITGTQPASEPGEVGFYVNDVSVAETNPAMRPVAHGLQGYTPQVAPRLSGTG